MSSDLLVLAESLARSAGTVALRGRRNGPVAADTKSSPTDIVTRWDRECERIIVEGITTARPDDAIIGEEGASRPGTSGTEWHIDPIDGTSNFFFDLPTWSVSIGARDDRGPLVGAVYLPVLDEMFTAARGHGAHLNGTPISPRDVTSIDQTLLATGFGYDPERRAEHGRVIARIVGQVRDIRRLGAASVDVCFVACGRLDAYVESGLNSWDLMAAQVVATEAGCTVTDLHGSSPVVTEAVVAAPAIHPDVLAMFGRAMQEENR